LNLSRLLESIKRHEGYSREPYKDHLGFWTIGTGHLLEDEIPPVCDSVGVLLDLITDPDQHERWLDDDVNEAMELAMRWLGSTWNVLNEVRKEVVVEMAFQLGTKVTKFVNFKAALINQDWETAADEMIDSLWHGQTPKRAEELARRMESGEA